MPVSVTNVAWFMQALLVIRTVGAAGTNSTAMLQGVFSADGAIATAGNAFVVAFGGTSASFDASIICRWTLALLLREIHLVRFYLIALEAVLLITARCCLFIILVLVPRPR